MVPITIGLLGPIPALVAAFLPRGFCCAQARCRRNIAHRICGRFLVCIQALGGAGGAYEDEKAAFALSPCIGSFKGTRSTTPRPHTPLVVVKRTSVEITALKSNISNSIARGTTTNTVKPSSIRIGHPICSSNIRDPFGSRSLLEAGSNAEYLWIWPSSSFGLDIH